MTTLIAATTLESAASDLSRQAGRLRRDAAELDARTRATTWEGPGGDRFRARARERARDLRQMAAELEAAARTLQNEAEATAQERKVLVGIERDVDLLRVALGPQAFAERLRASGISGLPPRGDTGWRTVARKLFGGR